jgi:hypothetical protein
MNLNCNFVDAIYVAISGRLYVPDIFWPVVKHLEMIIDWQQNLGSFITKLNDFVLSYIKNALIMFQPIFFLLLTSRFCTESCEIYRISLYLSNLLDIRNV